MIQYTPPLGISPTEKLIWLFIRLNESEQHSVRSIATVLDISPDASARALRRLRSEKLLDIVEPQRGAKAGRYRAVYGQEVA